MIVRPREVARGVSLFPVRTPTLPPATHTNSYALGERDVLLVEPSTPYDDERRAFLFWARGLASTGRRPVALFATHHHPDHVGGAAFLARELGLPLLAHEATLSRLEGLSGIEGIETRALEDGESLVLEGPSPSAWRVLHTPGHAPGHLCLFEEERGVLVAGDMVASEGTILIAPGDGHMATYLAELRRLAALAPELALPAHGGPIEDPVVLLERYVAHRLGREAKVLDALPSGPGLSLDALVALAYADTPPALWPIAKLSLAAHLEKLEEEGRASQRGEGWASTSA